MNNIVKALNLKDLNGDLEKCKTPIEERAKKTKFAKIISQLSDKDLKALVICLLGDSGVKSAITCYSQSVEHSAQLYALELEFKKRVGNNLFEIE